MSSKDIYTKSTATIEKGWGSELVIHNADGYCAKLLFFNKGGRGSFHFHKNKTETWYIQSGRIEITSVHLETGKTMVDLLGTGTILHIPACAPHQVFAEEETVIFEASTPHEDSDTYRIEPGDSQK